MLVDEELSMRIGVDADTLVMPEAKLVVRIGVIKEDIAGDVYMCNVCTRCDKIFVRHVNVCRKRLFRTFKSSFVLQFSSHPLWYFSKCSQPKACLPEPNFSTESRLTHGETSTPSLPFFLPSTTQGGAKTKTKKEAKKKGEAPLT